MGHHSRLVAKATANPTAQRVLLKFPDCVSELADNPFLADDVFAALYPGKKTLVSTAKRLLTANVLTDGQFDHLLAFETRGTVWNAMLEATGFPGLDRLTRLANSKAFTRATSDKIVADYNTDLTIDWLRLAADKVAGRALLELWLRCPQEFTDEEVSQRLRTHSTWGPTNPDRDRITWILDARPGAISGAAHSDHDKIRTWAAGCRHLKDRDDQLAAGGLTDAPEDATTKYTDEHQFQLLALANNPVVPLDVVAKCHKHLRVAGDPDKAYSAHNRLERNPVQVTNAYEEEADPRILAWLLKRALPYDGQGGRWQDLKALLVNPNLHEGEVAFIKGKVRDSGVDERVIPEFNALVDRFPDLQDSWLQHQPTPEPRTRPVAERDEPAGKFTDAEIDDAGRYRPDSIAYYQSALRFMERELGANEEAWIVALRTADNGFAGTIDDLMMVALASVAA